METRQTNNFGVQWKRCLRNASCSICPWIQPSKLSLKYQHSYLSHTLLLPFASSGECLGIAVLRMGTPLESQENWGCHQNLLCSRRERGGSPASQQNGRGQKKDWCIPGEGIICCTGFVAFPRAFIWAVFGVGKFLSPEASAARGVPFFRQHIKVSL